jgi:hypothetical protein
MRQRITGRTTMSTVGIGDVITIETGTIAFIVAGIMMGNLNHARTLSTTPTTVCSRQEQYFDAAIDRASLDVADHLRVSCNQLSDLGAV